MKVIKEGKNIEPTMRVTCWTCEAELEIEANDLRPELFVFGRIMYAYICPCCRCKNYLTYNDLSEKIRFDMTH